MERSDVFDRFNALWDRALSGPIGTSWHWLNYHFRRGTLGSISFTPRFLGALIRADEFMPGYAEAMISRLEQIHGREKNPDDYNTILQLLAEPGSTDGVFWCLLSAFSMSGRLWACGSRWFAQLFHCRLSLGSLAGSGGQDLAGDGGSSPRARVSVCKDWAQGQFVGRCRR